MRRTAVALVLLLLSAGVGFAQLPPVPVPPENPMTPEKRVLGKILFWDEQLSSDSTISCGSCHMAGSGGSDPRLGVHPGSDELFGSPDDILGSPGIARADAVGQPVVDPLFGLFEQVTGRAANSTVGAAFAPELFWDGRAGGLFTDPETLDVSIVSGGALENQAIGPILSDVEMAHEGRTWADVRGKLVSVIPLGQATDIPPDITNALAVRSTYPDLFQAAYGDPGITAERIAFAIATYERTLVADQAPWDAFVSGNQAALSPIERQGWLDFQASACIACHAPPLFTNHTYRNIGIRPPAQDRGRADVSGLPFDTGRFKVPTLRNVGLKPTFMHTGQLSNMVDAIAWYAPVNPDRSTINLDALLPLLIAPLQINAIAAFVQNGLVDPRVAGELFPFDRPTLHGGAMPELFFDSDDTTITWSTLSGVQTYNVYRGDLANLADATGDGLPDNGYGSCISLLDTDVTDTVFMDTEVPAADTGFFYLKSVVDGQGSEAGLGGTSAGLAREPFAVCP